VEFVLMK
jgi:hypothetical protein